MFLHCFDKEFKGCAFITLLCHITFQHYPNHWRCFPVGKYVVEFELLANGLKRYNAAKYLNTSIETFDQIVAARHIPIGLELMHSGQLFRKCDLDSSLERWRSQGHSRADDEKEHRSISLACKDAKVNVAYALKFIMSGSSNTVRIDPYVDGFETIMISSKELIAAYDAEYGVRENEIKIDILLLARWPKYLASKCARFIAHLRNLAFDHCTKLMLAV